MASILIKLIKTMLSCVLFYFTEDADMSHILHEREGTTRLLPNQGYVTWKRDSSSSPSAYRAAGIPPAPPLFPP